MGWTIELGDDAKSELAKLDKAVAKRIYTFLRNRLAKLDDPRAIGAPLRGSYLGSYWKYRVGDFRIIADIEDQQIRILIIRIGHRSKIYRQDQA